MRIPPLGPCGREVVPDALPTPGLCSNVSPAVPFAPVDWGGFLPLVTKGVGTDLVRQSKSVTQSKASSLL